MRLNIVQGYSSGRAKVISIITLENFYPEVTQTPNGKIISALIPTPGYTSVGASYTSGSERGIYVSSTDRFFIIVSNKLIEMSTSETFTERGTLLTSSGNCYITDNGTELFITDGTYGYTYNLSTNTLAQITDSDFPSNPAHCFFTKGYFKVMEKDSGKVWWSDLYDGTSWDSTHYYVAEYSQDNLQGIVKTSNGISWLIGKQSTELWQGIDNADKPWELITGSVQEIGCIAPDSIASNGSQVAWLGNNLLGFGSIYMGSGYEIRKISTPSIEHTIKNLSSDITLATAYMYSDETHNFYIISFSNEKTLVYDISTGEWHIRGTLNTGTGENIRQFSKGYGFFNSKHYVGHYQNANVYQMSLETYDEDGDDIRRVIIPDRIYFEDKLFRNRKLLIDMEKGIGNVGQGEPQITLQISDDGGHTYSSEAWADAAKTPGAIGEYTVRVFWVRLGQSRNRAYKFTMSADVKFIISGLYTEIY